MNTAPRVPALSSLRLLAALSAVALPFASAAHAQNVNSTLAGAGGTANWGDSATWELGTVPNATDAVVNISGSFTNNLALDLQDASNVNQTYTVGSFTFTDTASTFRDVVLQNGTINVATTINPSTWTMGNSGGGLFQIANTASVTSSSGQALVLTQTSTPNVVATDTTGSGFRFNSSNSWTNFQGTLTLGKGVFQANGNNSLPQAIAFTLGGGSDTAYLRLNGGQSQQVAALNGNAQSFIHTQSTTTAATLAINSAQNGTFAGTVGTNGNASFANSGINITKTGSGTQTFSGAIVNVGTIKSTVSVSGGTLVLSGANTYRGATTVNDGGLLVFSGTHFAGSGDLGTGTIQGNYIVNAGGTLRGTGTLRPFVDSATGGGVAISIRGNVNAGLAGSDFGTLTIDGQNSVKSLFIVEGTGTWTVDIGSGGNDRIRLVNAATNDFRFANGATIAFNDLSGGSISGNFIIGETDLLDGTAFTNLAGVNITGLSAYTGNYTLGVLGGNLVLSIGAIPEPSAYAAFAGLGALGLAALRRRRR